MAEEALSSQTDQVGHPPVTAHLSASPPCAISVLPLYGSDTVARMQAVAPTQGLSFTKTAEPMPIHLTCYRQKH